MYVLGSIPLGTRSPGFRKICRSRPKDVTTSFLWKAMANHEIAKVFPISSSSSENVGLQINLKILVNQHHLYTAHQCIFPSISLFSQLFEHASSFSLNFCPRSTVGYKQEYSIFFNINISKIGILCTTLYLHSMSAVNECPVQQSVQDKFRRQRVV